MNSPQLPNNQENNNGNQFETKQNQISGGRDVKVVGRDNHETKSINVNLIIALIIAFGGAWFLLIGNNQNNQNNQQTTPVTENNLK